MTNHQGTHATWQSNARPLSATIASGHGRPASIPWMVLLAVALGLIVMRWSAGRAPGDEGARMAALFIFLVLPVGALVGGWMMVGGRIYTDRINGALDQHRLAGLSPGALLHAYLLGPLWVCLLLHPLFALAALPEVATRYGLTGVAALGGATVAAVVLQLAVSVTCLEIGLTIPRSAVAVPGNAGLPGMLLGVASLGMLGFIAVRIGRGDDHRVWAIGALLMLGLGVARRVASVLRLLEHEDATTPNAMQGLLEGVRWLALVACVAMLCDVGGPTGFAPVHVIAAFGGVFAVVLRGTPSRATLFGRWAGGSEDTSARGSLMLGAALALLAAVEFVAVRATTVRFDLGWHLQLVLVVGLLSVASMAAAWTIKVRGASAGMSVAAGVTLALVATVLVRAFFEVGNEAQALFIAADAANPFGVLWGSSSLGWSPVVRVALAMAAAIAMVTITLRDGAGIRARLMASLPPRAS